MNVSPLTYWMTERHLIYLRRKAGTPPPWTADPVLRAGHFCNVFRELDRTTAWVRLYIREPYAESPWLPFLLVAARFLNHPPTLEGLLREDLLPYREADTYQPDRLAHYLEHRAAAGHRVWSPAYMVRCDAGMTKGEYLAHRVLAPLWAQRHDIFPLLSRGIETTVDLLSQQYGFAGFMAYEVATDLRWCRGWLLEAPDKLTYAHIGPGAVRGLNRLAGREVGARLAQGPALEETRAALGAVQPGWAARGFPALELRDIEHSLCEYDKYERAKAGRPPRRRFTADPHRRLPQE